MLQVKILQRRLILNFLCLLALIIHELESTYSLRQNCCRHFAVFLPSCLQDLVSQRDKKHLEDEVTSQK